MLSGDVSSEVNTAVDRDALSARLNALESYLAELRSFKEQTREQFVAEPGLYHLA